MAAANGEEENKVKDLGHKLKVDKQDRDVYHSKYHARGDV